MPETFGPYHVYGFTPATTTCSFVAEQRLFGLSYYPRIQCRNCLLFNIMTFSVMRLDG